MEKTVKAWYIITAVIIILGAWWLTSSQSQEKDFSTTLEEDSNFSDLIANGIVGKRVTMVGKLRMLKGYYLETAEGQAAADMACLFIDEENMYEEYFERVKDERVVTITGITEKRVIDSGVSCESEFPVQQPWKCEIFTEYCIKVETIE